MNVPGRPATPSPFEDGSGLPPNVVRRQAKAEAALGAALSAGEAARTASSPSLPAALRGVDPISIKAAYDGATVFLTGSSGYIGSVVLEQLLRCTRVARVFCVVRAKRGTPPAARIDKLLERPLFQALRVLGEVPAETRARIVVLEGDIQADRVGLAAEDYARVTATTTHIIHCAASISFADPVHALLSQNYDATASMLALARACPALKAFVHVSTAYVNGHLPRGTLVHEVTHDLAMPDGRPLDHAALADDLRAADAATADAKAAAILHTCGLPNAYCLTKHMTERMVLDAGARDGCPFGVAVVRPSIVGALARAPYPGYFGNASGCTSYFLAYSLGLSTYTCHRANSVFDLVPGDVVASVVLAAGAAAGAADAKKAGPPLILHAAASTTNPITHLHFFRDHVNPYYEANPAPYRFVLSYPRFRESDKVYMVESSLAFKALNLLTTIKFWVISMLLRLAGLPDLAAKVWDGWLAWRMYNTSKLDFGVLFSARNAGVLAARLPADERNEFRLQWAAPGDDWKPYLDQYMREIGRRYFAKAAAGGKRGAADDDAPADAMAARTASPPARAAGGVRARAAAAAAQ